MPLTRNLSRAVVEFYNIKRGRPKWNSRVYWKAAARILRKQSWLKGMEIKDPTHHGSTHNTTAHAGTAERAE